MKKLLHERLIADECGVCELECDGRVITLSKYDARALRKEIERYYTPRHTDSEGNPWLIGDKAIGGEDEEFIVQGYGYDGEYPYLVNVDSCTVYDGQWCTRPQPKALDADGVEIKVGDTVWKIDGNADSFEVKEIDGSFLALYQGQSFISWTNKSYLTHKEPDSLDKVIDDLRNNGTIYARRFADRLTALIERVD